MKSAKAAVDYLSKADYYASAPGDLLGKGFDRLDIGNMLPRDVLHCLAHNLDPRTGRLLRPHAKDGDRVGMDFTFNSTKSVGIARELAGPDNAGDPRIEEAHREAVEYAVGLIESDVQTRVRVGGADHDRQTGNLVAYRVTHRDTRINPADQRPDMSLHDHVFVFNTTFDPVEQKWKACQLGQIKHDAPYYEAAYHNRLASNLRELGYGVRRKDKAFEIAGISDELVKKFSRRTAEIDRVAAKLGISKPESKAKLGATTRLGKAKELADDLNSYYVSRLTGDEKQHLAGLQGQPSYQSDESKAVAFAIGHLYERQSVVEEKKLYETALRHGIGSVTLEGVMADALRQGVLLKGGEATTKAVLAEEGRIIDFAREGKGTCRPLGGGIQHTGSPSAHRTPLDNLSPEQQALVSHILASPDRVILAVGNAGTGKTTAVRSAFDRIQCPVEMLAPSATASRGVLRSEGFDKADTVASFLLNTQRQQAVKNGVIWVDEAGLLPIKDLSRLTDIAKQQNARIILQGDPKQHRSVVRHGNMMNVLQEYAGLKVGRLTEIWRQKHAGYKAVVADIADGKYEKGFDGLAGLGWVKQVEGHAAIVEDYMAGLRAG